MEIELKKEILKSIDLTRENLRNTMEISLESYVEILSKLDYLTQLLIKEKIK